MLELSELANKWFSYAHRDFDTAEHLVNSMKPIPVEIVCFHCQQSAEKFLKGFIVNFNKPIQKTHDLRLLVNECAQINAGFKTIEPECARLTPYGVHFRYPFAMEIEESDMVMALSDAKKVMHFVKNIFE